MAVAASPGLSSTLREEEVGERETGESPGQGRRERRGKDGCERERRRNALPRIRRGHREEEEVTLMPNASRIPPAPSEVKDPGRKKKAERQRRGFRCRVLSPPSPPSSRTN